MRVAASRFQTKAGGSPLVPVLPQQGSVSSVSGVDNSKTSSPLDDIIKGLGGLKIGDGKSGTTADAVRGEPLRIVDFVSPTLSAEEVVLVCSVTLKFNARTKLDKVSPAMWLVANPESSRRS